MIKAYFSDKIFGEELIRRAVTEYTGKPCEAEIKRRPTGKPYIEGGPCFSYSDSCGFGVCAVSRGEIGCDMELKRSCEKYIPVAKRFFHPKELEILAEEGFEEKFFEIYTAKEAYVKFTEMGIFSGLEKFSAAEGRVGDVNLIRFFWGNLVCCAASKRERLVETIWIS